MSITNLSSQYISASFQNLVQISGSGEIFNGTGTTITKLVVTQITGSVTTAQTALTASYALSSGMATLNTSSFAKNDTPNAFVGNQQITGDVRIYGNQTVYGDLTARQYIVSSSVYYMTQSIISGSTRFGDSADDTHQFTGSVLINGSGAINGYPILTNLQSGSFLKVETDPIFVSKSGSYATTASNSFTGNQTVTGRVTATSFTGSLFGTATSASLAAYSVSSSYAATASLLLGSVVSASYANKATLADQATTATSASYAVTASYVRNSVSASYAVTSSYSSYAFSAATSSWATNAKDSGTATSASYATTASYALYAANAPGGSGSGASVPSGQSGSLVYVNAGVLNSTYVLKWGSDHGNDMLTGGTTGSIDLTSLGTAAGAGLMIPITTPPVGPAAGTMYYSGSKLYIADPNGYWYTASLGRGAMWA